MCINPSFASQMRVAFSKMDWKTRSSLPEGELITASTSEVAACCSSASFSSRISRATSASWSAAAELRRRADLGSLRRFAVTALRSRVLTGLPPAHARRATVGSGAPPARAAHALGRQNRASGLREPGTGPSILRRRNTHPRRPTGRGENASGSLPFTFTGDRSSAPCNNNN